MQISENLNDGLKRSLTITLPIADLAKRLEDKIESLKGTLSINGFRPGKVPAAYIKRTYGRSLMSEIVQEGMNEAAQSTLTKRNERPAMDPKFSLPEGVNIEGVMDGKSDLAFTLEYEVLPSIPETDFSNLEFERLVAEIPDSEVDEAIQRLAEGYRNYAPKGDAAKAEKGDRLQVDFIGRIDGVAFEGGTASDTQIEIGSGHFIPGFEEGMIGAKAGETRTVTATFPDNYGAKELAGKKAEFEVTVKTIESPLELKIDDELATSIGLESLDKLREAVRGQLEGELGQLTRSRLKRELLDKLDLGVKFEVPPGLVEAEFNAMLEGTKREMQQRGSSFEDENTTEEKMSEEYRTIAERRVRLGLLLAEVGDRNKISITEQEVNQALVARARQFPGQERKVIEFYQKNPQALAELRAPIFEEKVVDYIISQAKVKDKTLSKDDFLKAFEDNESAAA